MNHSHDNLITISIISPESTVLLLNIMLFRVPQITHTKACQIINMPFLPCLPLPQPANNTKDCLKFDGNIKE
jgi:hypothetical protein